MNVILVRIRLRNTTRRRPLLLLLVLLLLMTMSHRLLSSKTYSSRPAVGTTSAFSFLGTVTTQHTNQRRRNRPAASSFSSLLFASNKQQQHQQRGQPGPRRQRQRQRPQHEDIRNAFPDRAASQRRGWGWCCTTTEKTATLRVYPWLPCRESGWCGETCDLNFSAAKVYAPKRRPVFVCWYTCGGGDVSIVIVQKYYGDDGDASGGHGQSDCDGDRDSGDNYNYDDEYRIFGRDWTRITAATAVFFLSRTNDELEHNNNNNNNK